MPYGLCVVGAGYNCVERLCLVDLFIKLKIENKEKTLFSYWAGPRDVNGFGLSGYSKDLTRTIWGLIAGCGCFCFRKSELLLKYSAIN